MTEKFNNIDLKSMNTMGVSAIARQVMYINQPEDLRMVPLDDSRLILGGGSNMLLPSTIDQLVLINCIEGIEVVRSTEEHVDVRIGGGENWHRFVQQAVRQEWGGVENLALIPGTVGAAPIQNIGAYGVELKDVFVELEAWIWDEMRFRTFSLEECEFGYRDSVFKNKWKGQCFITHITLRLTRSPYHVYNTSYRALSDHLGDQEPSLERIFKAVVLIRQSKLPDPKFLGNCGSFFKNVIIPKEQFDRLKEEYPSIPSYPVDKSQVKVPTAWLIDQCGWKGVKRGSVGVFPKQALVLVNYGGGTAEDILLLAQEIIKSVEDKFGIRIEPEVNIL